MKGIDNVCIYFPLNHFIILSKKYCCANIDQPKEFYELFVETKAEQKVVETSWPIINNLFKSSRFSVDHQFINEDLRQI